MRIFCILHTLALIASYLLLNEASSVDSFQLIRKTRTATHGCLSRAQQVCPTTSWAVRSATPRCSLGPMQEQSRHKVRSAVSNPLMVNVWTKLKSKYGPVIRRLRKRSVAMLVAVFLAFIVHVSPSVAATSAGRMGGSFGPSSSRSSSPSRSSSFNNNNRSFSRPLPSRTNHHVFHHRGPTWPQVVIHTGPGRPLYYPTQQSTAVVATRFTASDIVLLTGAGALITYGFIQQANNNKRSRDDDYDGMVGPLGPGATVASITVSLNVSNRNDPNNILNTMKRISAKVDTTSRKGVQALVAEVALALMRQESSVVSAYTQSSHHRASSSAQREFQRQSVQNRSKYDRETVNKFGNQDTSGAVPTGRLGQEDAKSLLSPSATAAVVTVLLSIEGDSTMLPLIRTRNDLLDALSRIASDAVTEDCLLSAEVIWAPEDRDDRISREELYAMHPKLVPI